MTEDYYMFLRFCQALSGVGITIEMTGNIPDGNDEFDRAFTGLTGAAIEWAEGHGFSDEELEDFLCHFFNVGVQN